MSDAPTAEHLAIANLAVQMLPKIELPKDWETKDPIELLRFVRRSTEFSEPILMPGGATFPIHSSEQKGLTAFEVLADEAVTRARIVLDSARGVYRQGRDARHKAVSELKKSTLIKAQQVQEWKQAKASWVVKFERYLAAKQKAEMTTLEMLNVVLPSSEDHMRILYWRDYLRKCDGPSSRTVVFKDETPPPGEHEVISDMLHMKWAKSDFEMLAAMAVHARKHYEKYGAAILKQWKRKHPKSIEGGIKTAEAKAAQKEADAAKYGGDVTLGEGVSVQKLDSAINRIPGASRPRAMRLRANAGK